jgi:hypothetical protein
MVVKLDPYQTIIKYSVSGVDPRYLTVVMTPLTITDTDLGQIPDVFSDAGIPQPAGIFTDRCLIAVTVDRFSGVGPVALVAGSVFDGEGRTEPAKRDLLTSGSVPLPTTFTRAMDEFGDAFPSLVRWVETQGGAPVSIPGLGSGYKSGAAVVAAEAGPVIFAKDKYNPFFPTPPAGNRPFTVGYNTAIVSEFGSLNITPSDIVYDGQSYTVIGAKLRNFQPGVGQQATFLCERDDP